MIAEARALAGLIVSTEASVRSLHSPVNPGGGVSRSQAGHGLGCDTGPPLWRDAPPPVPQLKTVVVVPARNEAQGLGQTLLSLEQQRQLSGAPFDPRAFEVLLLVNNSNDGSADLARAFAAEHPTLALHTAEVQLPAPEAHIGHVRRLLMDAACQRLGSAGSACGTPGSGGVVASTDGDTVVDRHWLAHTEAEFAAGADAVGGRIDLDPLVALPASMLRRHRYDLAYRLAVARLEDLLDPDPADPWPRHHQHFCASLAVKRQAYLQVGGVPAVRYLEDEALVAALRAADLRIRHSPRVRVRTSSRCEGRVEVGLSWQLRQWSTESGAAASMLVDAPAELASRLRARRHLRVAWRSRNSSALHFAANGIAHTLALPAAWLIRQAEGAKSFGGLWATVLAHAAEPPKLPVGAALDQLRRQLRRQGEVDAPVRSNTSSRYVAAD